MSGKWKGSNFLNQETRNREIHSPKIGMLKKKKKKATQTTEQQTFPVRKREIQFDYWTMCKSILQNLSDYIEILKA